jgi:hypothetical protein
MMDRVEIRRSLQTLLQDGIHIAAPILRGVAILDRSYGATVDARETQDAPFRHPLGPFFVDPDRGDGAVARA